MTNRPMRRPNRDGEFCQPLVAQRLHRRDDDVGVVVGAPFGFLDADLRGRVLDVHLVDDLLDEFVAVRDDERDVAFAQAQEFGQRGDDDGVVIDDAVADEGMRRLDLAVDSADRRVVDRDDRGPGTVFGDEPSSSRVSSQSGASASQRRRSCVGVCRSRPEPALAGHVDAASIAPRRAARRAE